MYRVKDVIYYNYGVSVNKVGSVTVGFIDYEIYCICINGCITRIFQSAARAAKKVSADKKVSKCRFCECSNKLL